MPSRAPFPATAWTQVLMAQSEAPESCEALEDICKAYWPAIYTYLRALGCEREEARDFTQDFLCGFIADGGLHRVAPDRGKLRSYMMQAVRNHLANARRDAARLKRGGGREIVSMNDLEAFDVPAAPEVADAWFDRRWAWAVLSRAMLRMEAYYRDRGRKLLYEALKSGLASQELLKSYAEIGATLGMTEGHVKIEMHRARKRLAEELRSEVASTLDAGGDVETELRYLLGVLGGS
ncbi:MAG: sigma-70 family RNA polymerase sigma factor [Verrucomicrobiaceae bacterium]|nr:sigma-70 family RNA polymerase sigma factor [Verrucomicrobiaceae bacterium]